MLEITKPEVLQKALDTWGNEAQYYMAVEECAELIQAICKHINRGTDTENLIEEAADVFIMLSQVAMMTGEAAIQKVIDQKLAKLEKRLNSGG